MTDRRDVDRLSDATSGVVQDVRADLEGFFVGLDLSDPEMVRDALLEFTPALVREYGDSVAAIAADWYEEIRADQVPGVYRAVTAAAAPKDAVEGSVRWAARHLWGDEPMLVLRDLVGAVGRHVLYSGRETVRRNVSRDPSKPRFARVPRGRTTCAFCTMLASRGFVYWSEATAGDAARSGFGDDFHDECDCQIVPEWDAEGHHIEGYDPDAMYERYLAAREGLGEYPSTEDILANMRAQAPEFYTDGHVVKGAAGSILDTPRPPVPPAGRRLTAAELATWGARRDALPFELHGEPLQPAEIAFAERMHARGETIEWIPRAPYVPGAGRVPTNDFRWLTGGGEVVSELKSSGTTYRGVRGLIHEAVTRAASQGVTKENFVLDLGEQSLTEKLRRQLGLYNQRTTTAPIRRLWVMSQDGAVLEEIELL